jgi:hypothetical protein
MLFVILHNFFSFHLIIFLIVLLFRYDIDLVIIVLYGYIILFFGIMFGNRIILFLVYRFRRCNDLILGIALVL